ncbi:MAG TPA: L,D-transpeptidase [Polyangiaceae bacterium]|nr:L,D-transpeptidase [Polyangiaceae bacterium]
MRFRALLLPVALSALGCKRGAEADAAAAASASAASPSAGAMPALPARRERWRAPEGPALGVIGGQANVYAGPSPESRRLGYLRLGAIVRRDPEPAGRAGCPGAWYKIEPRGYVCAGGDDATIDPNHPVLKAAEGLKPDLGSALPYRYGFVRAVTPLYLKVPSKDEQTAAEFKLKEHLDTWNEKAKELNQVTLGSYDVPVDERGVPFVGKRVGEVPRPSIGWGQGELFGASGEDDPIPFWLEGGRKIPNVSDFKVPPYAVFADRARRHTGLAFAGSFATGPESLNRRFAITTDLRLAPTSKVKPDTGSPWHGIELIDPQKSPPLPFAWVRTSEAKAYKFEPQSDRPQPKGALEKRSIVMLTGKKRSGRDGWYWEMKNGLYLKAPEAGVVRPPDEWPDAAKKGHKWVEVSIENQTLTLWEGQRPVYATLVSTGQDGLGDPKTTKSTVRGVFTIKSKHLTATMDSNERSGAGGGRRPEVTAAADDRPARGGQGEGKGNDKAADAKGAKGGAPKGDPGAKGGAPKGDGGAKGGGDKAPKGGEGEGRDKDYGVTRRRGEGSFWLRDVPYVQYFEAGYALHVAYWHDVFGVARSHGCINLSPIDGRWVFQWTEPRAPAGWHGVTSGPESGEGTTIVVHE